AVAVIDKAQLVVQGESLLANAVAEGSDLASDGAGLGLLLGGYPGIKCYLNGMVDRHGVKLLWRHGRRVEQRADRGLVGCPAGGSRVWQAHKQPPTTAARAVMPQSSSAERRLPGGDEGAESRPGSPAGAVPGGGWTSAEGTMHGSE